MMIHVSPANRSPHAEQVQQTLSWRGTPAADYIASPFSLRDLVARVTNLLGLPAKFAR